MAFLPPGKLAVDGVKIRTNAEGEAFEKGKAPPAMRFARRVKSQVTHAIPPRRICPRVPQSYRPYTPKNSKGGDPFPHMRVLNDT